MSDRYYGSISIPVNYLKKYEEELFDLFQNEFIIFNPSEKSGLHNILDAADDISDGVAAFSSEEAIYGQFSEIESALEQRKIPYDRFSASYFDDPEHTVYYRPELGKEVVRYGEENTFPCAVLREMLEDAHKAPLKALEKLQEMLDTEYDIQVEPLSSYAQMDLSKEKDTNKKTMFKIYQLKDTPENREISFTASKHLEKFAKIKVDDLKESMYDLMYTDEYKKGMILEDIVRRFNLERPADFKGHSLSVSDVIVIQPAKGKAAAYYVDDIGFTEIKGFCSKAKTKDQPVL